MNLPKKIDIVEVGPRDGFQSISDWISTELKIEIIDNLIDANFKKIEVTSFVSPKAIVQMKDAKEILNYLTNKYKKREVVFNALVPNLFGAKAANEAGVDEITYVISASSSHNMANVRRSREDSFKELEEIKKLFPNLQIKFAIATVFGCPFDGEVDISEVKWMVEKGLNIGVDEICLADTIGVANPKQMDSVISSLKSDFHEVNFGLHIHDTRGMGLANVITAMRCGITRFESAVGGLGGCPFAPGAAGNIASEDLINMMHSMGVQTGIDLQKILDTAEGIKKDIKPVLTSHMAYVKKECKV
jgi:hydroxymethylglutaryl-CoA lyase